jgi:hypothetical protein
VISHASIVIPFALGIGLSYFVFNRFAPEGFSFFLLVCLWDCHEHNCLSGFGTYRSGRKFIKRSLALCNVQLLMILRPGAF